MIEFALLLGGADALKLLSHRGNERIAVEVLVLVEVVAHAHAQRVERRGMVREAGDEDGDHVGPELDEVFEQPEAGGTRTEVPVEHGEVDGVFIGDSQRRLRIGRGEDARFGQGCAREA